MRFAFRLIVALLRMLAQMRIPVPLGSVRPALRQPDARFSGTVVQLPRTLSVMAILAIAVLGSVTSLAGAAQAGRYANSRSPYWQVGKPDSQLSTACKFNRFNQVKDLRLFIGYLGDRGMGVTGVAQKGWNLRDPGGLAKAGLTYHFADDGLSTCRVYVAGVATPVSQPQSTVPQK